MNPPPNEETTRTRAQPQEPLIVQLDPNCLHSALKEFFEPLRSNDPRTDFFAVYRKEADEFDRDYAKKYDEDLNTSLIFAGLFSAVSSAFIVNVQSKLEQDPNDMTAAYMRILIHAVNGSLFPDADPSAVIWKGPPPRIITVQLLLYASLAASLFAAFLAMLGKQWVNRYLRNRGGSAADKSRNRQQKLDGLRKWHFHLAMESLPVMLQFALLLLGSALSQYLWTICRAVAGLIIAVSIFGLTLYVFLTLAATLHYNCPYQTPPSLLARTIIKYLTHSDAGFVRSLRSLLAFFPSVESLRKILARLCHGVRAVLKSFRCGSVVGEEVEHIPLAVVVTPPARVFEDTSIDLVLCEADARCISWVLYSTTDADVIFSTVRFAATTSWYPETVGLLSPQILADLFFDCLVDGWVIPGKVEHASSIGMALASVLSTRLSTEPEDEGLRELCESIASRVEWEFSFEPTFLLVVAVLKSIAKLSPQDGPFTDYRISGSVPGRLSAARKLWLSRVVLQTIWRWRHVQENTRVLDVFAMDSICRLFIVDGDQMLGTLKTNFFLILAISLGLQIDIHDLYVANTSDPLKTSIRLFHQRLTGLVVEGKIDHYDLTSVLSTLIRVDPLRSLGSGELAFLWIAEILNSGYQEHERERMANKVVQLLGKHYFRKKPAPSINVRPDWIPSLLRFLSLDERLDPPDSTGFIALRVLSTCPGSACLGPTILPILTPTLLPNHRLQGRCLALNVFLRFMSGWFSPEMEKVPTRDLERLVQAVGDPFQFPDLPLQDGKPVDPTGYDPMMATAVLIEFASSNLWQDHLRRSNFTSFEEAVSTKDGKRTALESMLDTASRRPSSEFLSTAAKISVAIQRLEELQCLNTVEVVITWAWTVGVVNPVDHDAWKKIGLDTLQFYQMHGMERLTALEQHVTDTTMKRRHVTFLTGRYKSSHSGSGKARQLLEKVEPQIQSGYHPYLSLSQACQLRRLHQLFGNDPMARMAAAAAAAAVEEVDERAEVLSEHSLSPILLVDWVYCDYP